MSAINAAFWWLGVTVFTLAALYGLSEGAWKAIDLAHRSCGAWPELWTVMRRIYRERQELQDGR